MRCGYCGFYASDQASYCPKCGKPLPISGLHNTVSPLPAVKKPSVMHVGGQKARAPLSHLILAMFFVLMAGVFAFGLVIVNSGGLVNDHSNQLPSEERTPSKESQLFSQTGESAPNEESSNMAADEMEDVLSKGKSLLNRCEESGNQSLGAEAVELFSRASDAGSTEAGYYLAYCSYYGYGVVRDYEQAYNQALLAAQEGNASAQALVARCLYDGTGVSANRDQCYEWASKSAEQGNPAGQNLLGNCYKHGYGVEKNLDKMVYWYELAAEAGDDNGQVNLGACCYEGRGVKKDVSKAVDLYLKSAEQGNALAQLYLAECYYDGDGVKKDVNKARDLAEEAANNTRDPRAIDDARAFLDEHGL